MDVSGGVRAGAFDAEIFAESLAEDGFGEVGAAGIAGAENEDGGVHDLRCGMSPVIGTMHQRISSLTVRRLIGAGNLVTEKFVTISLVM